MKYIEMDQLRSRLEAASARRAHLLSRALGQLEFAKGLDQLHPDQAGTIDQAVAAAGGLLAPAVEAGSDQALADALGAAETTLCQAGLDELAKSYTMHCVGHAHIDMDWQWGWAETVAVTVDTFTTALALMEEFDDFCLSQSQASVYRIIELHAPDLLEAIRRRVAEGRWDVTAAHWVEGDKNLASGESLARHLLYTRRYLQDLLGVEPTDQPLDWEPDTFGHASTIPMINAAGGVKHYYFCRGGLPKKPPVFHWEAPDGSRILAARETTWYNDRLGHHNIQGLLRFAGQTKLRDWMCVYGVGDHGGGPTRRDMLLARDMDTWPIYPNVKFSTTRPFFAALEAQAHRWPVVRDELNYEFTGCYTSQSRIKWANRKAECELEMTDAAAATARIAAGRNVEADKLQAAWRDTLLGHFHDILPGSGVRETREEHMGRFAATLATTNAIRTSALRQLARQIDTQFAAEKALPISLPPEASALSQGAGVGRNAAAGVSQVGHVPAGPRAFVVFNPTAFQRREVVTLSVWDDGTGQLNNSRFAAIDATGSKTEAQELGRGHYWGHDYIDLAVPVTLPASGFAALAVVTDGRISKPLGEQYPPYPRDEASPEPGVRVDKEAAVLENEHLRVELDTARAAIVSLVDKESGLDLACNDDPMGRIEWVVERPGSMTSWRLQDLISIDENLRARKASWTAAGPHLGEVRFELQTPGASSVEVRLALAAGEKHVRLSVHARWVELGGPQTGMPGIRLALPTSLSDTTGRYEVPFGYIDRDAAGDQEVPSLRFAQVTGNHGRDNIASLLVANDCKYGHRLDGGTLRINLIRSSYDPDPLPEIGDSEMYFTLQPVGGQLEPWQAVAAGMNLNLPLQVVSTDVHAGALPSQDSWLRVEPEEVVLAATKWAEDGDGLILRLQSTEQAELTAKIDLIALGGKLKSASACDLLERPDPTTPVEWDGRTVRVSLRPLQLASVRLRLAD